MNKFRRAWAKLRASKKYREHFVAAHAKQSIPFQIRTLMKQHGLSQQELAERAGLTQGAISRAANPSYGNLTINTLVRVAAGFDMAFIGRFVPFSELARSYDGLSEDAVRVKSFTEEDRDHSAAETIQREQLRSLDAAPVAPYEEDAALANTASGRYLTADDVSPKKRMAKAELAGRGYENTGAAGAAGIA